MSIVNINALKGLGAQLWWPGQVATVNAPKAITAAGDAKQILPFAGAGIAMFDSGAGSSIYTTTGVSFGTGDFTIETLFYTTGVTSNNRWGIAQSYNYYTAGYNGNWLLSILYDRTSIQWASYNGTSNETVINTSNVSSLLTLNTWHRIVVQRSGTTLKIYLNGVEVGSGTESKSLIDGANGVRISRVLSSNVSPANFSEYRISSVARYTTVFPAQFKQLESDSNTMLLIHFNRNDATFIDSSPNALTITASGNAKQLCSPCGSGVAYFDGSGDYLTCGTTSSFNFLHQVGTVGKWSISFRYQWTNRTSYAYIFNTANITTTHGVSLVFNSNRTVSFMLNNGIESQWVVYVISTNTLSDDANWHTMVITYDQSLASDNLKMYVDGASFKTGTKTAQTPSSSTASYAALIGVQVSALTYPFQGYLSEFAIYDGVCIDGTVVPTAPFAPDPYTKLLLHMDGVGNAFYDSSDPPGDNGFPILPDGVTVTPSGTFTTQKMKDGRNVWVFDGSTNYITISDHATWSMFLNDFTIAAWIKFDSIAANRTIIGQYADANNQWYVKWTTSNIIQLYGITSSTARFNFTCPLTPVAETWYHVVVQRSGSSCVMYINGVVQTVTQTTAFSATATDIAAVLSIGKINTEYQAGNTKDLQIFNKALTMDQVSALYQETYIY